MSEKSSQIIYQLPPKEILELASAELAPVL